MPRRLRFGVSVPEEVAVKLDRLRRIMNVSRSEVVTRAIELMVEEYKHYLQEHLCRGVMVVVQGGVERPKVSELLEDYSDIVLLSLHYHVAGACLEIVVVEGASTRIAEMHSRLERLGCKVRYIPLGEFELDFRSGKD